MNPKSTIASRFQMTTFSLSWMPSAPEKPIGIRPELGLAYYGITLIPPETLDAYLEIVWKNPKLSELAALLIEAKEKHAFVIHFGI